MQTITAGGKMLFCFFVLHQIHEPYAPQRFHEVGQGPSYFYQFASSNCPTVAYVVTVEQRQYRLWHIRQKCQRDAPVVAVVAFVGRHS